MAETIDRAILTGRHALIQAGTGTGKSLGYLAPLVAHLHLNPGSSAVVATATLALQAQLAGKDIPAILGAAQDVGLGPLTWSVLKGTSNYACLLRLRDVPADPAEQQYTLEDLDPGEGAGASLAQQVLSLRTWAEDQAADGLIADRDDAPRHTGPAWGQVSISGRECVGGDCPYNGECFVRAAREVAATSQLVVTNHSLVALEADRGWSLLKPDVLVLDEAHELPARVTSSRTDELTARAVERAARIAGQYVEESLREDLARAAGIFGDELELADPGRVRAGALVDAAADLGRVMRKAWSQLEKKTGDARRVQAANVAHDLADICNRISSAGGGEVVWVSVSERFPPQLYVAPIQVADVIRELILDHQTSVLTSATLKLGDSFEPLELAVGLAGVTASDAAEPAGAVPDESLPGSAEPLFDAIDVGSPFDYGRQGICYVAAHLPAPGRDGISDAALDEIVDLVEAAGGHTLGLFSSMRAAKKAAEFVRDRTEHEVLLQGEEHLPELIERFKKTHDASLFGTISLWQGVDAPGQTCFLVIVDRIPFPRPDEPLLRARQEDVARRGGNGFMQVAASHAALMLAQGTGRLIRGLDDLGVVAILDSRLLKAGYGSFLVKSMPPLWMTKDRKTVLDALARLRDSPPGPRQPGTSSPDDDASPGT